MDTHLPTPGVSGSQAGGYVGPDVSTPGHGERASVFTGKTDAPGSPLRPFLPPKISTFRKPLACLQLVTNVTTATAPAVVGERTLGCKPKDLIARIARRRFSAPDPRSRTEVRQTRTAIRLDDHMDMKGLRLAEAIYSLIAAPAIAATNPINPTAKNGIASEIDCERFEKIAVTPKPTIPDPNVWRAVFAILRFSDPRRREASTSLAACVT